MKAASRLADCLLKDLSRLDMPLSSEYTERVHLTATYMWYGCCGSARSPASSDGIGADLSQNDCVVLFDSCCQYLQLLLLGQKEVTTVPKQLAIILRSFKNPLAAAGWKVVIAGLEKVFHSIITSIQASASSDADHRVSVVCCLAETVSMIVAFLVKFQNSEAAVVTAQDFLSSLESNSVSDFLGQINLGGLKLLGSILETFVQSTASAKPTKEQNVFSLQIVEKSLSSLNDSLRGFKPICSAKLQPAIARVVIMSVENLTNLLLANKVGEVLSAEGLEAVVRLYALQLELCEASLSAHKQMSKKKDGVCQLVCLKRDVWLRMLQIINVHLQKDKSVISGGYV